MLRIAVSGVGGGVGQSIMKSLSISSLDVQIYPVDITSLSAGLYRGHQGTVLPRPESPEGLEAWAAWLREAQIDALIPGSDHDLIALASVRDQWLKEGICNLLVSDLELVETCRDKARTCARLLREGLPAPASLDECRLPDARRWARDHGYPFVLKPRDGFASRNVHVVHDEEELEFYFKRTPLPLLQEYLHHRGEVEEFTCAVFVDRRGEPIGTFMARRDLAGGATYRAEVNEWPEIDELLRAIGRALKPRGPLNVQLRMTERGPVPFELNLRCSGTAAIRSHFGYNEPEMLVRHYVLDEELPQPVPRKGFAFRYWNEVFLEGVSREQLLAGNGSMHGEVRAWP